MHKLLTRIVALLLVPCLIADPIAATTFNYPLSTLEGRGCRVRGDLSNLFQQEALSTAVLDIPQSFQRHITERLWSWLGERLRLPDLMPPAGEAGILGAIYMSGSSGPGSPEKPAPAPLLNKEDRKEVDAILQGVSNLADQVGRVLQNDRASEHPRLKVVRKDSGYQYGQNVYTLYELDLSDAPTMASLRNLVPENLMSGLEGPISLITIKGSAATYELTYGIEIGTGEKKTVFFFNGTRGEDDKYHVARTIGGDRLARTLVPISQGKSFIVEFSGNQIQLLPLPMSAEPTAPAPDKNPNPGPTTAHLYQGDETPPSRYLRIQQPETPIFNPAARFQRRFQISSENEPAAGGLPQGSAKAARLRTVAAPWTPESKRKLKVLAVLHPEIYIQYIWEDRPRLASVQLTGVKRNGIRVTSPNGSGESAFTIAYKDLASIHLKDPASTPSAAGGVNVQWVSSDRYPQLNKELEKWRKRELREGMGLKGDLEKWVQNGRTQENIMNIQRFLDPIKSLRVLAVFLVRDAANEIIGITLLQNPVYISDIQCEAAQGIDAVSTNHQRQGIGKALRKTALSWMRKQGHFWYVARIGNANTPSVENLNQVVISIGARMTPLIGKDPSETWHLVDLRVPESPAGMRPGMKSWDDYIAGYQELRAAGDNKVKIEAAQAKMKKAMVEDAAPEELSAEMDPHFDDLLTRMVQVIIDRTFPRNTLDDEKKRKADERQLKAEIRAHRTEWIAVHRDGRQVIVRLEPDHFAEDRDPHLLGVLQDSFTKAALAAIEHTLGINKLRIEKLLQGMRMSTSRPQDKNGFTSWLKKLKESGRNGAIEKLWEWNDDRWRLHDNQPAGMANPRVPKSAAKSGAVESGSEASLDKEIQEAFDRMGKLKYRDQALSLLNWIPRFKRYRKIPRAQSDQLEEDLILRRKHPLILLVILQEANRTENPIQNLKHLLKEYMLVVGRSQVLSSREPSDLFDMNREQIIEETRTIYQSLMDDQKAPTPTKRREKEPNTQATSSDSEVFAELLMGPTSPDPEELDHSSSPMINLEQVKTEIELIFEPLLDGVLETVKVRILWFLVKHRIEVLTKKHKIEFEPNVLIGALREDPNLSLGDATFLAADIMAIWLEKFAHPPAPAPQQQSKPKIARAA